MTVMILAVMVAAGPPDAVEHADWAVDGAAMRREVWIDGSDLSANLGPAAIQLWLDSGGPEPHGEGGPYMTAVGAQRGARLPIEVSAVGGALSVTLELPELRAGQVVHAATLYLGGDPVGGEAKSVRREGLRIEAGRVRGGWRFPVPEGFNDKVSAAFERVPGRARPALRHAPGQTARLSVDPGTVETAGGWTFESLVALPEQAGGEAAGAILAAYAGDNPDAEPIINVGLIGRVFHTDSRNGPDGPWFGAVNSAALAEPGQWHAFSVVYDVEAACASVYVDGELAGSGRCATGGIHVDELHIGGWRNGPWQCPVLIDRLVITPQALSGDEVRARAMAWMGDARFVVFGPWQERGEAPPAPPSPSCLAPTGRLARYEAPRMRWSVTPGATGYAVKLWRDGAEAALAEATVTGTRWEPEVHFEPGASYRWEVQACLEGLELADDASFSIPAEPARDVAPLEPRTPARPMVLRPAESTRLGERGPVARRATAAMEPWALRFPLDNPDMTRVLREQWRSDDGIHAWWGESYGKFITGATLLWEVTGDPRLKALLDAKIYEAIAAQEPDGYLGAYPEYARLTGPGVNGSNWDLSNMYHVGSSRVDLQACKLEYSIVSPK